MISTPLGLVIMPAINRILLYFVFGPNSGSGGGNSEIKYHSAVIFVQNIEISKRFYTESLGQAIELDFGKNVVLKGSITLWEIETEEIERVFQELEEDGVVSRLCESMTPEQVSEKTTIPLETVRELIKK